MKKNPQLPHVNCKYGAPMGRASYGAPSEEPRSLRLFQVMIDSGGYDEGGAYWGLGGPLFCAMDGGEYRAFTRAANRNLAAAKLGLKSAWLRQPLAEIGRHRFKIVSQAAGLADKKWSLYEWGAMKGLCQFETKDEALDEVGRRLLNQEVTYARAC